MADTKTTPIELAREILEARDQIEATSHKAKDFVPHCVVVAVHSLELLEQAEQLAHAVIDEWPKLDRKWKVGTSGCACLIDENDNIANKCKLHSSLEQQAYQRGHSAGVKEKDTGVFLLLHTRYKISKQEYKVLKGMYELKSRQEIAYSIGIERNTVNAHAIVLFRKLGVNTSVAACAVLESISDQ